MSRMFEIAGRRMKTWNVFVGCKFGCSYCQARRLAEGRLLNHSCYKQGFQHCQLVEVRLRSRFKAGEFVFVSFMGDIRWAQRDEMDEIYLAMLNSPGTHFLLMSKDPQVFKAWQDHWGYSLLSQWYIGTTIETNRDELVLPMTRAPAPSYRYASMVGMDHPSKLVSIEPVMDFDLDEMVRWVRAIQPQIVYIGADSGHNKLLEPPWSKVQELVNELRLTVPVVIEKPGLERLKDGGTEK